MVNYQFLNDYCDGNIHIYDIMSRQLKQKHEMYLEQLNNTEDFEEIKIIVSKISEDIFDVLLYGNNLYYKIILDILLSPDLISIPPCKFEELYTFPIDYYLLHNDIWKVDR